MGRGALTRMGLEASKCPLFEKDGIKHQRMGDHEGQQSVVRDWTQENSDVEIDGWGRLKSGVEHVWEANFEANKKQMGKPGNFMVPIGRPVETGSKVGRTAYLVGNGPSIKNHWATMIGLDELWGCNRIGFYHDKGVKVDYYAVLDAKASDYYGEAEKAAQSGATGLFSIFANPEVTKFFDKAMWFNVWGKQGSNKSLWSKAQEYAFTRWGADKFHSLDSGWNVCYSMLHAIYKMGYSKCVLLGMDHAFSGGYEYFTSNEPWIFKNGEEWVMRKDVKKKYEKTGGVSQHIDIRGQVTWSANIILMALNMFLTASQFVSKDMEIVNCSEDGILQAPWIKQDRLENHV